LAHYSPFRLEKKREKIPIDSSTLAPSSTTPTKMKNKSSPTESSEKASFDCGNFALLESQTPLHPKFPFLTGLKRCAKSLLIAAYLNLIIQSILIATILRRNTKNAGSLCKPSLWILFVYKLEVNVMLEVAFGLLVFVFFHFRQDVLQIGFGDTVKPSGTVVYAAILSTWVGPLLDVWLQAWGRRVCSWAV